ncbi:MAG: molybdopterin molybdotransferase MoeA, partial [Nitrososphaerota archaeon]|nr:molybdopterin molybdotransferase MoeA [Nitrososphaerota archaeon]
MKNITKEELSRDALRFLKLSKYEEIHEKLVLNLSSFAPRIETIRVDSGLGRIAAEDVKSEIEIPSRDVTAMDGYAVRFSDLKGASLSTPVYLSVKGSIFVEHGLKLPVLLSGEAYYVATGSPLPKGSDTVVRVEEAVQVGTEGIEVKRVIPKGKDVAVKGEDIEKGEIVVRKGKLLTPIDVALLIGVGKKYFRAYRVPNVGLLSIGNELKEFDPTDSKTTEGTTINNYLNLLFGFLLQLDSNPVSLGICGDDQREIRSRIKQGLKQCDMILTISGSSVGRHDNVLGALQGIQGSETLFHGARVVPIKPCGVVTVHQKPIVIIPGHAVSSLLTFFTIALHVLNVVSGLPLGSRKVMIGAEASKDIVNERSIDALCLVKLDGD